MRGLKPREGASLCGYTANIHPGWSTTGAPGSLPFFLFHAHWAQAKHRVKTKQEGGCLMDHRHRQGRRSTGDHESQAGEPGQVCLGVFRDVCPMEGREAGSIAVTEM